MPPLVSIEDIKVWFPIRKGVFNRVVGNVRAVDGVRLDIMPGETMGLVGESGCGKTTIGRTIIGLQPVTSGRVLFDGQDIAQLGHDARRQFCRSCQMVFQDPFSSLNPRMTVLDIITEALVYHGIISSRERESKALELLAEVGMGRDALNRYPHEFSGGQRQRISIARALSLNPKFIVCDEPVSALDVSVQAQVINLLMDLREKHSLSFLFISHDLSVVRLISHRVAVMYLGHIVELGKAEEVLENPLHPYTQALLSAVPRPGKNALERIILKGELPSPANPPSGCPFHPRCPLATAECRDAMPPMAGAGHQCACYLAASAKGRGAVPPARP